MPQPRIGELLVPVAERIDASGLGDEQRARALDVLDTQRLDLSGIEIQQVLAPQQLVERLLADRVGAAGALRQLAFDEVLVAAEPDARPARGVLDPFRLGRELALEHPRHLVDVRRAGEVTSRASSTNSGGTRSRLWRAASRYSGTASSATAASLRSSSGANGRSSSRKMPCIAVSVKRAGLRANVSSDSS